MHIKASSVRRSMDCKRSHSTFLAGRTLGNLLGVVFRIGYVVFVVFWIGYVVFRMGYVVFWIGYVVFWIGYVVLWTDYLTSRSACMAIPPPGGFEALVVAN